MTSSTKFVFVVATCIHFGHLPTTEGSIIVTNRLTKNDALEIRDEVRLKQVPKGIFEIDNTTLLLVAHPLDACQPLKEPPLVSKERRNLAQTEQPIWSLLVNDPEGACDLKTKAIHAKAAGYSHIIVGNLPVQRNDNIEDDDDIEVDVTLISTKDWNQMKVFAYPKPYTCLMYTKEEIVVDMSEKMYWLTMDLLHNVPELVIASLFFAVLSYIFLKARGFFRESEPQTNNSNFQQILDGRNVYRFVELDLGGGVRRWVELQRVPSSNSGDAIQFHSGDTIQFHSGDTIRGSINLNHEY